MENDASRHTAEEWSTPVAQSAAPTETSMSGAAHCHGQAGDAGGGTRKQLKRESFKFDVLFEPEEPSLILFYI